MDDFSDLPIITSPVPEDMSPLHLAAQNGNIDEVNTLLKNGASVDAINSRGETPLYLAALYGHIKIVTALLAKGANVNKVGNYGTPLSSAIDYEHLDVMEVLLKSGADINIPIIQGATQLHMASSHGNGKIVKILVDNKANVNAVDDDGLTPLHYALEGLLNPTYRFFGQKDESCYTNIIIILLQNGANVHSLDHDGKTWLSAAVSRYPEIASLLHQPPTKPKAIQEAKPHKDSPDVRILKNKISRYFADKENPFDAIFKIRGIYKSRIFPVRHDQRNELLKEVDALLESKESFADILDNLISAGNRAQKHHETVSGWRNPATGKLINTVCGFKEAVNNIVKELKPESLGERSLLLSSSYNKYQS